MLRYAHAWRDPEGDPDAKETYKFPHHRTLGGPANLRAVRNGLARLSQADIPEGDRPGVERHLRRHLEDAERSLGRKIAIPDLSLHRLRLDLYARLTA